MIKIIEASKLIYYLKKIIIQINFKYNHKRFFSLIYILSINVFYFILLKNYFNNYKKNIS